LQRCLSARESAEVAYPVAVMLRSIVQSIRTAIDAAAGPSCAGGLGYASVDRVCTEEPPFTPAD
jgi:hypothetical protein